MAGGVGRGVCIQLPPAIFKNVFDVGNFSTISNLFDSDKSYAVRTHSRIIENMRTNASCLAKHSKLGSKFKQNMSENYSKRTKTAIPACKFSKFFRGSMPRTPVEPFLLLNQLQISSAEKNTLENM